MSAQYYILRNHFATTRGSNRTQVPILKHGMRPAFASLTTVIPRHHQQFREFISCAGVTELLDAISANQSKLG